MIEPIDRDLAALLDSFIIPPPAEDFAERTAALALANPALGSTGLPRLRAGRSRAIRTMAMGGGLLAAGLISISAAAMGFLGAPLDRAIHHLPVVGPLIERAIPERPRRHLAEASLAPLPPPRGRIDLPPAAAPTTLGAPHVVPRQQLILPPMATHGGLARPLLPERPVAQAHPFVLTERVRHLGTQGAAHGTRSKAIAHHWLHRPQPSHLLLRGDRGAVSPERAQLPLPAAQSPAITPDERQSQEPQAKWDRQQRRAGRWGRPAQPGQWHAQAGEPGDGELAQDRAAGDHSGVQDRRVGMAGRGPWFKQPVSGDAGFGKQRWLRRRQGSAPGRMRRLHPFRRD